MSKIVVSSVIDYCLQGVVIIGANVDGKPNFMVNAFHGTLDYRPPLVGVEHHQYTHKGILQNMTFSLNLPSMDLVKEVAYCGSVSGAEVNKAEVCKFGVFYGKLGTAPLIEQCPINIECSVVHTLDLGTHSLFVGKVEETRVSENCLTDDGRPDFKKIKPLYYARIDREGQVYHLYVEVESNPGDPQALPKITAATVVEHPGELG